jgi:signal transduction histidine kinase/ActR/RegA family two-component response regulator
MEQRIAGDRWLRVSDRRTVAGGTVTICTDITELKRDARALAEARDAAQAANSAKSQFLANMSHEIRTPLNGVIGVAQALANTDLSAQQAEMLELIQSSSRTLQVLLSDILDLARVESGRLELTEEAFDLGRAVREAAQLYETSAREKGLQFFVEITPDVDRWIAGDVVRLKQILTNLVSNSVKFTAQGFVCLTAMTGPVRNGQPTLRFAVEDTGIGFDSDTRNRLFSRFEQADGGITRKFGGSGLGLSISRQLAEMMGGELDCESEPGGGSSFMLTIPLRFAEAPATPVVEDSALAAGDDRRLRVLLADDHPVNRKVVEMILAQAEIDLTSVEDGAQALNAVRDGDYDLILMDMQMPVMDGLTATREIRLHETAMGLPRTPVVMLTANALPEHIASAEAAGADRHLAKPFDAGELLELVISLPRAAQAAIAA